MKGLSYSAAVAILASALSPAFAEGDGGTGMSLMPVPIVFSSPETGLGGGAILMAVGELSPGYQDQKQDCYRLMGMYTVKSQSAFAFQGEHFSPGNGIKLDADASFSNFPSVFYGIGGPGGGVEEGYTIRCWNLDASAGFKMAPELYLGPSVRWTSSSVSDRQAGGVLEGGEVEGSGGASYVLAGPRLTYEGRDSSIAPARGFYADLGVAYSPSFAGDTAPFSISLVDLRGYFKPVDGLGAIVAGQVLASTTAGDPPLQELPRLGGDGRLRGFIADRYVDRAVALAQVEVRAPVVWRLGLAAFCGVGALGPSIGELKLSDPLFAEGLGLRILLDKKSGTNLRVDLAWGEGKMQTYFQLGEAF